MYGVNIVGIDDIVVYIFNLYLLIEDFVFVRDLEYVKFNKGLGLIVMLVFDVYEDVVIMAVNVVLEFLQCNVL